MEFNRLRPAIRSLWMSISAAKLNMHYSVRSTENGESTLHTGVGKQKVSQLNDSLHCMSEEFVINKY